MQTNKDITTSIYTYAYDEGELELCNLELRSFFKEQPKHGVIESLLKVDPNRSPFIRERLDVIFQGNELHEIVQAVKFLPVSDQTFKVLFVKYTDFETEKVGFKERRQIEREVGLNIPGNASLLNPDIIYGIIYANGRWAFGTYLRNEAVWLGHQQKPQQYSTALSTRVARAVVNIAVPEPDPTRVRVIDPCCGIGTVLIEALSMGINITGSDINPLVTTGARENIRHFQLQGEVLLKDIRNVEDAFDVAIIDLPYNLCSVISESDKKEMFSSARRFTKRMVVVTIEKVDDVLYSTGFTIIDRCEVTKGSFVREVIVCE